LLVLVERNQQTMDWVQMEVIPHLPPLLLLEEAVAVGTITLEKTEALDLEQMEDLEEDLLVVVTLRLVLEELEFWVKALQGELIGRELEAAVAAVLE
jgi:hypothetical protein